MLGRFAFDGYGLAEPLPLPSDPAVAATTARRLPPLPCH